jgi:hypothetical protein
MIERIVSECASNLMLVLIRLTEPPADIANQIGGWATDGAGQGYGSSHPIEVLMEWIGKTVAASEVG